MKTPQYSDQDTIQRSSPRKSEQLHSQKKMKDLALAKATNLIELLNIELQVQRNTSLQNLRQKESQVQKKYEAEIQYLRKKVQELQLEISKAGIQSHSTQKWKGSVDSTVRKSSFLRTSSVRSFDNNKKQSVAKKCTQNTSNQSIYKNGKIVTSMISDVIFKNQIIQLQQWKQSIVSELDKIVKQEYSELGDLINAIQKCGQDFQELALAKKEKSNRNLVSQMGRVLKQQQSLINTWRAYSQELQDLHKSFFIKMQSTTTSQVAKVDSKLLEGIVQRSAVTIKQSLVLKKQHWRNNVGGLKQQNDELKNILDDMIKLVKEEKKIKL